jgi:plastocyanin
MVFRLGAVALAVVCASGCGSSYSSPSPSTTPTPTPAPSSTTVSIPSNARTLGSAAYGPNPLTVPVGTTVTWMNNDTIAHTSTSTASPPVFDTGTIAAGASASFRFNTAGSFPYHCTLHPGMVATITVQ